MDKKLRIVFMGTPSFAVPILEGLIEEYEVVLVVCQPDRKKDRKGNVMMPDTKVVAKTHNIDVFQPISVKEEYQHILDYKPDLIVTAAYGQFIPNSIVNYPKYGCINVHGSLLPKLRGGAPIHWAIINGFKETGVTVMKMSSKMDAGDIITQRSIEIGDDEILESLYERMSILGKDLLLETIPSIVDGTAKYFPQNENEATFGYNVGKDELKLDFSKSAIEVKNKVRGLANVPAAYTILDGKRMKIYKVRILSKVYEGNLYGKIDSVTDDSIVVTVKGGYIEILDMAIEGKKRSKVYDYFNGCDKFSLVGKVFE